MAARSTALRTAAVLAILAGGALRGPSPAQAAVRPNASIFFFKHRHAVTGVLKSGVFTQKRSFQLKGSWTHAAASRDSLLLYNSVSGKIQTGTFVGGVYTKKRSYSYYAGLTNVAASCDSVILYDSTYGFNQTGTLQGGILTFTDRFTFGSGWNLIDASCDTLSFWHTNGTGAMGTFTGGEYSFHISYTSALNALSHVVHTDTSFLLYSSSERSGEWGTATGGVYTQTGQANDFSPWDKIAGTGDSLLFYDQDGSAAISTLRDGAYAFVGAASLSAGWRLIAGGR